MLNKSKERTILEKLNNCGHEAYFVGGCVRDTIRGHDYKDIDIATSATPEEVKRIFPNTIDTGIKYGTVTIMPEKVEVTTFRAEGRYLKNRRPETVEFVKDLTEDLKRRDFTFNAMAMDKDGKVFDPFDGRDALLNGVIVAVGNPDERFTEDALRIMRALRFAAAFGFVIEKETAKAMRKNKELLKNISAERIYTEFRKILNGDFAHAVIREYVDVLGVIIPELLVMVGFEQNSPYHVYDVFEHTIKAVEVLKTTDENRVYLRMAMLFHDIGKPSSYTEKDGVGHFYGHPEVSAEIAKNILRRLKADKHTTGKVVELVENHDIILHVKKRFIRKKISQFGENFLDLIEIRKADTAAQSDISRPTKEEFEEIERLAAEVLEEENCLSLKDLRINGKDIMELGVKPGPEIGQILHYLLGKVINEELKNEKEILLAAAERRKK